MEVGPSRAPWLFQREDRPLQVHVTESGRTVIIGDLWRTSDGRTPAANEIADEHAPSEWLAQHLLETYWGRYVALLQDGDGPLAVVRDPSGAMDMVSWRYGGGAIVASELHEPLLSTLPEDLHLDWNEVHRQLAYRLQMTGPSALAPLVTAAPGSLTWLDRGTAPTQQMWRPSHHVEPKVRDAHDAQAALRARLDLTLRTLARDRGPILVEASGGLDSSIVAAALKAADANVPELIHYGVTDTGGDERHFATLLAERTGIPLRVVEKRPPQFRPEATKAISDGLRPTLVGLDDDYDRGLISDAQRVGAHTVFSGQGGDAVFFEGARPEVIIDRTRRLGPWSLLSSETVNLARWSRRSVWSMARLALAPEKSRPAGAPHADWITPCAPNRHPWLDDLDSIPPAKRLQVQYLAAMLVQNGVSRSQRALDLIHPLMMQPLMELALGVPVDLMVKGGLGRAWARTAFADRLPAEIRDRRSKGELGSLYGPSLASALPSLRTFLLEGRLAAQGLIDRARLESALEESALANSGGLLDILRALSVESWVRHWEEKIRVLKATSALHPEGAT
jgi:asparagine synthase (glutamine-hydrolysing)